MWLIGKVLQWYVGDWVRTKNVWFTMMVILDCVIFYTLREIINKMWR